MTLALRRIPDRCEQLIFSSFANNTQLPASWQPSKGRAWALAAHTLLSGAMECTPRPSQWLRMAVVTVLRF